MSDVIKGLFDKLRADIEAKIAKPTFYVHPAPVRPPREVYVRSSRPTEGGAIVEPGIEYRDGDDFTMMAGFLNYGMFKADPGPDEHDPVRIAEAVEARIKERWPDRAYFVEVHDPRGGWIQIFQPFGVPRNR